MEIFNWVKEIEDIYENLIDKSKKENLAEINDLRSIQEKFLDEKIKEKQEFVKSASNANAKDIDDANNLLKEDLKNILKKIEVNYQEKKEKLIQLIIEKLGFDF